MYLRKYTYTHHMKRFIMHKGIDGKLHDYIKEVIVRRLSIILRTLTFIKGYFGKHLHLNCTNDNNAESNA